MARKKRKGAAVSGKKDQLRKKLSKPQPVKAKRKAVAKADGAEKVKRIPQRKLTASDKEAFRSRAYMGPLETTRVLHTTIPQPTEQLENTIFMERLRDLFEDKKSCIMTCATLQHGLRHTFFLVGTDRQVRFATDKQFSKGIGVGNPTFNGKKKTTGNVALADFLSTDGIIPQRNKPNSYRYFPATEENFDAVVQFMETIGFTRKTTD